MIQICDFQKPDHKHKRLVVTNRLKITLNLNRPTKIMLACQLPRNSLCEVSRHFLNALQQVVSLKVAQKNQGTIVNTTSSDKMTGTPGPDIFFQSLPLTYDERRRRLSESDAFTATGTYQEHSVASGQNLQEAGHDDNSAEENVGSNTNSLWCNLSKVVLTEMPRNNTEDMTINESHQIISTWTQEKGLGLIAPHTALKATVKKTAKPNHN